MDTMPYFTTPDGCSLYYELLGQGPSKPTITFINGTLQTTIYWRPFSKILADHFRLLLYDCRGQGASNLGDEPLTLTQHASDLQFLLYDLKIHQTHIVAISHGARVALALADSHPELVARMVLCSISTQSNFRAKMIVRSWFEILQRHSLDAMVWAAVPYVFGRRYLQQNAKILDRIVKTIVRRNNAEALRAHLDAMQKYPALSNTLHQTPFLTLVVTGEDDPLVTCDGGLEIARTCGGRHEELKGIGHSIPAEAPDLFTRLVSDFLSPANKSAAQ
jgi:3-oxoadipate enol-lactonase